MTNCTQLEILFEDPNPHKWCHPMKEDGYATIMSKENSTMKMMFGPGSFFSPLLFGKFFDPSDAFPLWEFNPDELLPCHHNSSGQRNVDWFQTDTDYVLKAEIPGISSNTIEICIENGKIAEISLRWRQEREKSRTKEWKSSHWWEHGVVRRLELPDRTNWKRTEAYLKNDQLLEIKIPKTTPHSDATSQAN